MGKGTEQEFKEAMLNTYYESVKLGYKPTYFLRMVQELGAIQAAKQLIHVPKFSTGFTKLWELKRLDLSVEALVIQPHWQEWFSDADRKAARDKLAKLGYPAG
jgi:hypothetical protein